MDYGSAGFWLSGTLSACIAVVSFLVASNGPPVSKSITKVRFDENSYVETEGKISDEDIAAVASNIATARAGLRVFPHPRVSGWVPVRWLRRSATKQKVTPTRYKAQVMELPPPGTDPTYAIEDLLFSPELALPYEPIAGAVETEFGQDVRPPWHKTPNDRSAPPAGKTLQQAEVNPKILVWIPE